MPTTSYFIWFDIWCYYVQWHETRDKKNYVKVFPILKNVKKKKKKKKNENRDCLPHKLIYVIYVRSCRIHKQAFNIFSLNFTVYEIGECVPL